MIMFNWSFNWFSSKKNNPGKASVTTSAVSVSKQLAKAKAEAEKKAKKR